jgi:xanthine dehydrogenase accessory factor
MALCTFAQVLGFRTVVIDPRRAFGNAERFPHVDQLLQEWPEEALARLEINEKTAIAVLTHDPKIDDPALKLALPSPAFYVGALGSPTTAAKRKTRLQEEAGLSPEQLERIHGPIGLKLGGRTPEEIALAVMAEIVAVQHRVMP